MKRLVIVILLALFLVSLALGLRESNCQGQATIFARRIAAVCEVQNGLTMMLDGDEFLITSQWHVHEITRVSGLQVVFSVTCGSYVRLLVLNTQINYTTLISETYNPEVKESC